MRETARLPPRSREIDCPIIIISFLSFSFSPLSLPFSVTVLTLLLASTSLPSSSEKAASSRASGGPVASIWKVLSFFFFFSRRVFFSSKKVKEKKDLLHFSIALGEEEQLSLPSFVPPLLSFSFPFHARLLRPFGRGAPAGQRGDSLGADRRSNDERDLPPVRERWRPRRSRRHLRGRDAPQARSVAQRDRDGYGEPHVVSWCGKEVLN